MLHANSYLWKSSTKSWTSKKSLATERAVNTQKPTVILRTQQLQISARDAAGDWALEPTDIKNDPFHKPQKIQNSGPTFQVAGLSLENNCDTHLSAHVYYNTAKDYYHAFGLLGSLIWQQTALCCIFCETIVLHGCWHNFKDGQQQMKFHSSLLRAALDIKQLEFRSGQHFFCTCWNISSISSAQIIRFVTVPTFCSSTEVPEFLRGSVNWLDRHLVL